MTTIHWVAYRMSRASDRRPRLLAPVKTSRVVPPLPEPDLTCAHRGDVIRQQAADLCGLRGQLFDVFACDLHGECSLRRVCFKQTVQSCTACKDRG